MSTEKSTWAQARDFCENHGGHLLEVYTQTEIQYVKKILTYRGVMNVWLGTMNRKDSDKFSWITTMREPSYHVQWASGFPMKINFDQTCISIITETGSFINIMCQEKSHFICKKAMSIETNLTQSDSKLSLTLLKPWAPEVFSGSSEYALFNTGMSLTWKQSRTLCQKNGLDLAAMDSDQKLVHLLTQLSSYSKSYLSRIWLGAKRFSTAKTQYEFNWVNHFITDSVASSWIIEEENRETRCVFVYLQTRAAKPLFSMTTCDATSNFDIVVCEKAEKKYECHDNRDCHELASCIQGHCFCSQGFAGNGRYCFDIDECNNDKSLCPAYSKLYCTNTVGSFNCSSCDHQFQELQNGESSCVPKDPCAERPCRFDPLMQCISIGTTFTCKCSPGFINHGAHCYLQLAKKGATSTIMSIESLPWDKASAQCEEDGGHLKEFASYAEWIPIRKIIQRAANQRSEIFLNIFDFWLGAKVNESGSLVWSRSLKKVDMDFDVAKGGDYLVAGILGHSDWYLQFKLSSSPFLCSKQLMKEVPCQTNSQCSEDAACSPKAYATNDDSHRFCQCGPGFYGNGAVCKDIDECELGIDDCVENAICNNTLGSHNCSCSEVTFGGGKTECFRSLKRLNNSEYFASEADFESCFAAYDHCLAGGGTLASFETEEEWEIIKSFISDK